MNLAHSLIIVGVAALVCYAALSLSEEFDNKGEAICLGLAFIAMLAALYGLGGAVFQLWVMTS